MRIRTILFMLCAMTSSISCLIPSYVVSNERSIRRTETFDVFDPGVEQCAVTLTYKANGDIEEVHAVSKNNDSSRCGEGPYERLKEYISENSGSVVFDFTTRDGTTGKMICYGPPIPSPPKCVCTSNPCPSL